MAYGENGLMPFSNNLYLSILFVTLSVTSNHVIVQYAKNFQLYKMHEVQLSENGSCLQDLKNAFHSKDGNLLPPSTYVLRWVNVLIFSYKSGYLQYFIF